MTSYAPLTREPLASPTLAARVSSRTVHSPANGSSGAGPRVVPTVASRPPGCRESTSGGGWSQPEAAVSTFDNQAVERVANSWNQPSHSASRGDTGGRIWSLRDVRGSSLGRALHWAGLTGHTAPRHHRARRGCPSGCCLFRHTNGVPDRGGRWQRRPAPGRRVCGGWPGRSSSGGGEDLRGQGDRRFHAVDAESSISALCIATGS
jgi:hypothetical protein